jgi:hypothetical protein
MLVIFLFECSSSDYGWTLVFPVGCWVGFFIFVSTWVLGEPTYCDASCRVAVANLMTYAVMLSTFAMSIVGLVYFTYWTIAPDKLTWPGFFFLCAYFLAFLFLVYNGFFIRRVHLTDPMQVAWVNPGKFPVALIILSLCGFLACLFGFASLLYDLFVDLQLPTSYDLGAAFLFCFFVFLYIELYIMGLSDYYDGLRNAIEKIKVINMWVGFLLILALVGWLIFMLHFLFVLKQQGNDVISLISFEFQQ